MVLKESLGSSHFGTEFTTFIDANEKQKHLDNLYE